MQAFERIREALKFIVCPVCHGALSLLESSQHGEILCNDCARRYPVEDGIPILLETRASLPKSTES